MDDEGRAVQFDYVFLAKLRQCARYCLPRGTRELSDVFMGQRKRCANCSIRDAPVRRRFEQEFRDFEFDNPIERTTSYAS